MLSAEYDKISTKSMAFECDVPSWWFDQAVEDDRPRINLMLSGDGRTLRDGYSFCFFFRRTQSNIGFAFQQSSKFAFRLPF